MHERHAFRNPESDQGRTIREYAGIGHGLQIASRLVRILIGMVEGLVNKAKLTMKISSNLLVPYDRYGVISHYASATRMQKCPWILLTNHKTPCLESDDHSMMACS